MKRELCAAAATVLFASAAPAVAQTTQPSVPPAVTNVIEGIVTKLGGDAAAPYGLDPNHSRGRVTYFKRFDLQIRMPLNTYRDIHLHQGTVINPRGASIENGQVLDVVGRANPDGSLNADTITILH
jgi:opacity protein-like surface antigen